MKRLITVVVALVAAFGLVAGHAQDKKTRISIGTGGAAAPVVKAAAPQGFLEFMMHIVPDNFVGAFAKGELLQVVVLAVMVGIGILAIPQERREKINGGLDYISEVLFSFINLVMKLAPIGTFGAVAWYSRPCSGVWNDAEQMKICSPSWIATTRRAEKLPPSRLRSTVYTIGLVKSPRRRK